VRASCGPGGCQNFDSRFVEVWQRRDLAADSKSRRVHFGGCTANPSGAWVLQQARNLSFTSLFDRMRFPIYDRDSKFSAAFDDVFRSEGITVIDTDPRTAGKRLCRALRPHRALRMPRLAADHRPQPPRVCTTHLHGPLQPRAPSPRTRTAPARTSYRHPTQNIGTIERRDRLGGLIHEHHRAAA
jgi:putative transposase